MKLLIVFLSFSFAACSSHQVYSMKVDPVEEEQIKGVVKSTCGKECKLRRCWYEEQDFLVCRIDFVPKTDGAKAGLLQLMSSDIYSEAKIPIGLCGHGSAEFQGVQPMNALPILGCAVVVGVLTMGAGVGACGQAGGGIIQSSGGNLIFVTHRESSGFINPRICSSAPYGPSRPIVLRHCAGKCL
jgi:hypothetical protein